MRPCLRTGCNDGPTRRKSGDGGPTVPRARPPKGSSLGSRPQRSASTTGPTLAQQSQKGNGGPAGPRARPPKGSSLGSRPKRAASTTNPMMTPSPGNLNRDQGLAARQIHRSTTRFAPSQCAAVYTYVAEAASRPSGSTPGRSGGRSPVVAVIGGTNTANPKLRGLPSPRFLTLA